MKADLSYVTEFKVKIVDEVQKTAFSLGIEG